VDAVIDGADPNLMGVHRGLTINHYAEVQIAGPDSVPYKVQHAESLNGQTPTNSQTSTSLTLSQFPHLFIDTSRPIDFGDQRFYRSVNEPSPPHWPQSAALIST
jgi:hypothetical protein